MSRVGLVVPTLGEPERRLMLEECLSSIEQSGCDVVVVTVESRRRELERELSGVRVLAQSGRGIADAIEAGWAVLPADLPYLTWLGDDDRLVADGVSACADILDARPSAGMVFGRCRYIRLDGAELREIRPGRIAVPLLALGTNLIAQPGTVYRRSTVERLGGLDRNLRLAFDVDLHRRVSKDSHAVYVPRVLGEARVHPTSLTTIQRASSVAELELVITRELGEATARTQRLWRPVARFVGRVAYKVSSRVAVAQVAYDSTEARQTSS